MEDPLMYYESYWDRLNFFELNSTQRRVERYRLIYTWKSLNGLAPSLGMTWNMNSSNRNGKTLNISNMKSDTQAHKTLRMNTIQHEGVKLMNCIPKEIRNFIGKLESFKLLLDSFLMLLPDQPETEYLKQEAVDQDGSPSNSIYDWIRKLHINWKPSIDLVCINSCYVSKLAHDNSGGRHSQTPC